jgi:uncharacterized protein (UPF0305 family)
VLKESRVFQEVMNRGLALAGVIVVVGVVGVATASVGLVAIVVIGLVMMEVGIWRAKRQFAREKRRYHLLRTEVKRFLSLVRQLHNASLHVKQHDTPDTRQAHDEILNVLHETTERIAEATGKTDDELAPPDQ